MIGCLVYFVAFLTAFQPHAWANDIKGLSPVLIDTQKAVRLVLDSQNRANNSQDAGNKTALNYTCGVPMIQTKPKIVGGEASQPGTWPWQALMKTIDVFGRLSYICGGTLIHPDWVVTAAHCTDGLLPSKVHMILGSNDYNQDEEQAKEFAVSKIVDHPEYIPKTNENDISLIQLAGRVTYTDYIIPACLPPPFDDVTVGLDCWITGWGGTEDPNLARNVLREAIVPVLSNAECQSWYNEDDITIYSQQLCAGYEKGGVDTCQGDSGGPLVCQDNSSSPFILQGVTSFGKGCADHRDPGVYTRVSNFTDWIEASFNANTDKDAFFSIPQTPCGSVITSPQQIRLPVDPETQLYFPNMHCTWIVDPGNTTRTVLSFDGRFAVQNNFLECVDYFQITWSTGSSDRYCSANFPSDITITHQENAVFMFSFISDGSIQLDGFAVDVSFHRVSSITTTTSTKSSTTTTTSSTLTTTTGGSSSLTSSIGAVLWLLFPCLWVNTC